MKFKNNRAFPLPTPNNTISIAEQLVYDNTVFKLEKRIFSCLFMVALIQNDRFQFVYVFEFFAKAHRVKFKYFYGKINPFIAGHPI